MSGTSKPDAVSKTLGDFQAVGDAVQQVGDQARQASSQAFDHLRDVAQDAKARSASLSEEMKGRTVAAAEAQKDGFADRLQDVAQAVHHSGEQLKGHQDWIAGLVERGADELAALARTVRTNDLRTLLGTIGDIARRQPALFVGASLAGGFALARVGRIAIAQSTAVDLPTTPGGEAASERE